MRQMLGAKKLRQVSDRFNRIVTEVLVRGGGPHGCGWARFQGQPRQVWIDYENGVYLNPHTGEDMKTLDGAVLAVETDPPPPLPPTKERMEFLAELQADLLKRYAEK
jgi:hypothetical protein